jgi:CheY-like chemotaxis protein
MKMPANADNQRQATSCDVLIVEDDIALGDVIASYLTRDGLVVQTAHSATAALRLLQRGRPRVVVLDYHLPGQTGLTLAHAVLERYGNLPIIMMSGSLDGIDDDVLKAAGIRIFVNKPVPLAALHRAVLQLMA